jgi:hypothetical protein
MPRLSAFSAVGAVNSRPKARSLLICEKPLAAFSLKPKAQRKSFQKETPKKVSRSAEREEGCAPSTARAFEKARPKLLSNRQTLSTFFGSRGFLR